MSGISRRRATLCCAECARRKVSCSKTIPCSRCVEQGIDCTRENASQRRSATPLGFAPRVVSHPTSPASITLENNKDTAGFGEPPSPVLQRNLIPDPSAEIETGDRAVESAATILEYLAWGRKMEVGYTDRVSPYVDEPAEKDASSGRGTEKWQYTEQEDGLDLSLEIMQLLLPSPPQVRQIVQYHLDHLLWYHGSFHGPTFSRQLREFYEIYQGLLSDPGLDLQWVALLFAVLTGSIACGNKAIIAEWGFREAEQERLSRRWMNSSVSALNKAQYMARPSILACETIATLTMPAHTLGFSNQQSILLASATRIAQSLGLHRLSEAAEKTIARETGRRVWGQLVTQDWFSIPFSECYLVSPLHSKSRPPLNCNDETLEEVPSDEPTITSYCRFLICIAELMPQLQDDTEHCNTLFTKYEQVLKYDRKMRILASDQMPPFLRSSVPLDPLWPPWTMWARRSVAISSSHKIIMIHRQFMTMSFTNPAFAFTRRTCIAASKTILNEFKQATSEDGPVLWIYHAFTSTACITLCLDLFHREASDSLYSEHLKAVQEGMMLLRQARNSRIASRSVRILSDLIALITSADCVVPVLGKRKTEQSRGDTSHPKRQKSIDMHTMLRDLAGGHPTRQTAGSSISISPSVIRHAESAHSGRRLDLMGLSPTKSAFAGNPFGETEGILAGFHSNYASNRADAFSNLLGLTRTFEL